MKRFSISPRLLIENPFFDYDNNPSNPDPGLDGNNLFSQAKREIVAESVDTVYESIIFNEIPILVQHTPPEADVIRTINNAKRNIKYDISSLCDGISHMVNQMGRHYANPTMYDIISDQINVKRNRIQELMSILQDIHNRQNDPMDIISYGKIHSGWS